MHVYVVSSPVSLSAIEAWKPLTSEGEKDEIEGGGSKEERQKASTATRKVDALPLKIKMIIQPHLRPPKWCGFRHSSMKRHLRAV